MSYPRIVHREEPLMAAMLEAIQNGCFVFAHDKRESVVISKNKPKGDYRKIHGCCKGMDEFMGDAA